MIQFRWPHRWTSEHRQESKKERTLCTARRALAGVRADSRWFAKRPFSDQYGYDRLSGGDGSGWRDNDSWRHADRR